MSIDLFPCRGLVNDAFLYRLWMHKINTGEAYLDLYRDAYVDKDGNIIDRWSIDRYSDKARAERHKADRESRLWLLPSRLREILREKDLEKKEVLRVAEMKRRLAERADLRMVALRHKLRYAALLYGTVLGALVAASVLVVALKALLFTVLG